MNFAHKNIFTVVALSVVVTLSACSRSAPRDFEKGLALFKSQDYAAAARCFEKALAGAPPTAQALNFLGVCELQQGHSLDAIRHFDEALKLEPTFGPARYNIGLALLERGQAEDAAMHLRLVVAKPYAPADAQFYLGLAYLRAGSWLPARQALQKVAEAHPSPELLNYLGQANTHLADYAQARQNYEQAIKIAPKYAPAYLNLATVEQQHLNLKQTAMNHYQAYLDLLPKGQSREDIRLAIIQIAKELSVRSKPTEIAVVTPVKPPEPAPQKVIVAIKPSTNTAPPLAVAPATNVVAIAKPTLPPAVTTTAKVEVATAKPVAAPLAPPAAPPITPAPLKKTRSSTPHVLHPGDHAKAKPLFNDAVKQHQQGNLPAAIALYSQAIAADPEFTQAYYNLAIACHDARQPERALDNYELALTANPGFTDARFNYAIVLNEQGYIEDALTQYEYLLKENPTDASLHLTAATLYARDRSTRDKARQHYEAYLKLTPKTPLARDIRAWLDQNK